VSEPERHPRLILASRSPRRRQLLAEAGYRFQVIPPSRQAERGGHAAEDAAQLVARLARRKAADVARRVAKGLILGCDTVAEHDGRILGKPRGQADARRMLHALRGQHHRVLTGVCLWRQPDSWHQVRVAVTRLWMEPLSDRQIEEYLASGAWQGKAGAFGLQDRLGWVRVVEGSESNVVGLPLELLAEMLDQLPRPSG